MDGADDGFIQVLTVTMELRPGENLLPDSLPHFGGRCVCEGDRSQFGDAVLHKQGDVALHEDAGLAAPSTRRDEHIASALGHDRGLLQSQSHIFDLLNPFTLQMCWKEQ